jgi:uncharacterized membrane protein
MQSTRHEPKESSMSPSRLEAFSDGVLAVIITIMVLELKPPQDVTLKALWTDFPVFLSYVLSFVNVGIYWNNHHHLLRASKRINGTVMWANLNLLFWLSLMPFFTSWLGSHPEAVWPTFCYGLDLLLCGCAYFVLQSALIHSQGPHSDLEKRLGRDLKGKLSMVIYLCALGLAFLNPVLADAAFVSVAIMWFIPDRRLQ